MQYSKFRIAIIGLGGVGGYLGVKLAAHYSGSNTIEINFISRGENLKVIQSKGLKLFTDEGEETGFPFSAVTDSQATGKYDLVICCVKGYDLEASLTAIKGCLEEGTLILPFLNGVDASERIEKLFPTVTVLGGCCYIIARLEAPGVIRVAGSRRQFHIGSSVVKKEKLDQIASIFLNAGIDFVVSENIVQTIWTKFLLISAFATLTSALDSSIGVIFANEEYKESLVRLLNEVKGVAEARGIVFENDIINTQLKVMSEIPYESTSSLHSDLKKHTRSEIESIIVYVVKEGEKLNFPVPCYQNRLAEINTRWRL
jgi:2-dehydropantoate 2-reductase